MKKIALLVGLVVIILILGFLAYQEIRSRGAISKNNVYNGVLGDLMQSETSIDGQEKQASVGQGNNNQAEKVVSTQVDQASAVSENVEIVEPADNSTFFVGDTFTMQLRLKTDGLVGFMLYFQGLNIFDIPTSDDPAYKFIVNGGYIEGQKIVIIANYQIGNEIKQEIVSRNILITPKEQIISLRSIPEEMTFERGKSRQLEHEAFFPTATAKIGETDLVQVNISDPNILSYDAVTGYLTGLEEGSALVTTSYRGQTANSVVRVYVYREPTTD